MWVFLQELVQGKGVLKGLDDGDAINRMSAGVFAVLLVALTTRFLVEPPAGGPLRGGSVADTIKSNPTAYERAKSLETLVHPRKNDKEEEEETVLMNYNDGRSPFGLKKNAEIWNGRIAMVRF